jgi:hypothetical protein
MPAAVAQTLYSLANYLAARLPALRWRGYSEFAKAL